MDILTFAKRILRLSCHPLEGDTMVSFLRRCREMMSPTKWKYWQSVCEVIKAQIRALLKTPIHTTPLEASVLGYLLIHLQDLRINTIYSVYEDPELQAAKG